MRWGWARRCRRLDEDVVELAGAHEARELFDEVLFERAAYAAVLEGDEVVVLSGDHAAFFDEVGVDVHFADVVDDDGHLVTARVLEQVVDERCLTASEITGYECDWYGLHKYSTPLFPRYFITYPCFCQIFERMRAAFTYVGVCGTIHA